MSAAIKRCAVIGAGSLGGPIAERLVTQGHDVTVCDLDPAKRAALAAKGARTTDDAGDCAACETVLILVATEAQVHAVVAALAARVAHGGTRLARVAVMSTVPPAALPKVAAVLEPLGIRVLDAPNSGGGQRALAGRLTVMAGGAAEDLAAFRPVLSALADNIFPCGGLGAGQIVKVINNVLCHANYTLTAEVFRLGMAQGLAPEMMARVMEVSTGRNYLTVTPIYAVENFTRYGGERAVYDEILTILQKDTRIAADMAAAHGAAFPMVAGLADLIGSLGDETFETLQVVTGRSAGKP